MVKGYRRPRADLTRVTSYNDSDILAGAGIITASPNPMPPIRPVIKSQGGNKERRYGKHRRRRSNAAPVISPIPETKVEGSTPAGFGNFAREAIPMKKVPRIGGGTTECADQELTGAYNGSGSPRVAGLVVRLQNIAPTQEITVAVGLLKSMQVNAQQTTILTFLIDNAPSSPRTEGSWLPPATITRQP